MRVNSGFYVIFGIFEKNRGNILSVCCYGKTTTKQRLLSAIKFTTQQPCFYDSACSLAIATAKQFYHRWFLRLGKQQSKTPVFPPLLFFFTMQPQNHRSSNIADFFFLVVTVETERLFHGRWSDEFAAAVTPGSCSVKTQLPPWVPHPTGIALIIVQKLHKII